MSIEPQNDSPRMTHIGRTDWWLCERCNYSMMRRAIDPAPVCPACNGADPDA